MSSPTTTPSPKEIVKRIGDTNERALAYVKSPDPKLSRLPRAQREQLIAELPPLTAGALLGPDALARHLVASAASGRYRDLFTLWDLFRSEPDACRPVLADRPQALAKAREALDKAVRLGLSGHAERVAEDVARADGLIWQWLREILMGMLPAVGARPAVASALLLREPDLDVPLPDEPDERWLAEAAALATDGALADPVAKRLAAGADRLPATVATLQLAHERFPEKLPAIIDRVQLDSPEIGAMLAWIRDHGLADELHRRVTTQLEEAAGRDRAEALALWRGWRELGVEAELPATVRAPTLDGLDPTRPETADLLAVLVAEGADLEPQKALEKLAGENRQRAEKAFEAFVCADLAVELPRALEGNPIVREGTRCPYCLAWTWVRPGHEGRCPRRQRTLAEQGGEEPAGSSHEAWDRAPEPAAIEASPSASAEPGAESPPAGDEQPSS